MKVVQILKVISWGFIILVLLLAILVSVSFYLGSEAATTLPQNPEFQDCPQGTQLGADNLCSPISGQ